MSAEEREEWLKQKKKAKVNTKKWKTLFSETVEDFVKVGGVYQDVLEKYRLHRFHRIFLGPRVALKMIREFTENMNGKVLELQSDYSEKYQPQPDGDFQSQYFNKQNSLSMEGHAARYWNAQKEKMFSITTQHSPTRRDRIEAQQKLNGAQKSTEQ